MCLWSELLALQIGEIVHHELIQMHSDKLSSQNVWRLASLPQHDKSPVHHQYPMGHDQHQLLSCKAVLIQQQF